jgi:arylsulfatase A-like enzyme
MPIWAATREMRSDQGDFYSWDGTSAALFPAYAVLGVALPVCFLAAIEQYLYYLRPIELLPTYGTAWLLLAILIAPWALLTWFVFLLPVSSSFVQTLRSCLRIVSIWIGAMAVVGALSSGFLLWIRSFGILKSIDPRWGLIVFCVVVATLFPISRRFRSVVLSRYSFARYATILGALTLASLPFFPWNDGSGRPTSGGKASPSIGGVNRPHILLVTVDTLSAENMSLYGAPRRNTPNLEAFASTAMTFNHAYANGNFTTAGIASILTGTRPWTHRAIQLPGWPIATARDNSLPALLSEAGYNTGYVSTNAWAGATRMGLGRYFTFHRDRSSALSVCEDGLSGVLRYDCPAAELIPFRFAQMVAQRIQELAFNNPANWQFDPRAAINPALEWLSAANKNQPIFLWVHLMPPHSPYAAPAPWLGEFDSSPDARTASTTEVPPVYLFTQLSARRVELLEARYDESIHYMDHYLGDFLRQALPLLGSNTAVIITADHGESFSHGYGMHTGPGLFEPIIHIPLVIKLPAQDHGARTSDPAEQVDVAPTVAALAGLAAPPSWEGRSLLASWDASGSGNESVSKPVFSMNFEQNPRRAPMTKGSVAVVEGDWKLIHYMGALRYPLMPSLQDELFDLSVDSGELHNLIAVKPAVATQLGRLVTQGLESHGGALP